MDSTQTAQDSFLKEPSFELLRTVLPLSHFRLDLDTMRFSVDRQWGPLLALPPAPFFHFEEFSQGIPEGAREHMSLFFASLEHGFTKVFHHQFPFLDGNGNKRWFEWRSVMATSSKAEGSKRVLEGILMDITAQRAERPELSESERWFMEVLDESPHALYRIDHVRSRFDYISAGFARSLGRTREEILAMPYAEFMAGIHPDDMVAIAKQRDELMVDYHGGRFTMYVEFRFKQANGEYIWLNDTFTYVPGPDGQFTYQVGFGAVIDDRKRLEEQLRVTLEQLENKVEERTASLNEANLQLTALMEERRELERKLLDISERERRFIGRELHDGLCQQIAGVMCMSDAVYRKLKAKTLAEQSELAMMRDFLHDAVQQTRTLARGLCPLALDPQAIGDALSTLASQTSYMYKVDCRFEGKPEFSLSDPSSALHLYRITQETIQNAIRHGGASHIKIRLSSGSDRLHLVVENDGRPLPRKPDHRMESGKPASELGIGLKLVDYRVDLLGGTWKMHDLPGDEGVRVSLDIPIDPTTRGNHPTGSLPGSTKPLSGDEA